MSKVDRVVVGVLISIILFCFYMNSKWWFFVVGICTSVSFGITIGFWLQGASHKKNEKEWKTFPDFLDEDKKTSKTNLRTNSVDVNRDS